ncbi:MAG: hypothetical protein KKG78_02405 [Alphaproteobacteria bacterium]|nr:hypothetical protein [Alphaproteobacteria bacterium]
MSYAEVVSTLAALAGGGSLYLHYRRWIRDLKSNSLIVRAEPGDGSNGSVRSIKITLRSRSNIGYRATEYVVLWPLSATIMLEGDCHESDGFGNHVFVGSSGRHSRRLKSNLEVAHVGQKSERSAHGGPLLRLGDTNSEKIFIEKAVSGLVILGVRIEPEGETEAPFTRWKRIRL